MRAGQNPAQYGQDGGGEKLPPENGTNWLAQRAKFGIFHPRELQSAEIIWVSHTAGQRVATQNSVFDGQRSFFSNWSRWSRPE